MAGEMARRTTEKQDDEILEGFPEDVFDMNDRKQSKVVVITGATDGIGLELAKLYGKATHLVIATGRKTSVDDQALFGDASVFYFRADQSDPNRAAANILKALDELNLPGPDLCILNAAMGWTGRFWEEPPETVQNQITVNITAQIAIAHALASRLKAAKGHLVFIGSTAQKGAPGFATYAATKAALDGLARSLWAEWRGDVMVSTIHPGPTRTTMHAKVGLKLGAVRLLFMPAKRAAKAIIRSIRKRERRRMLTRSYGWGSIFTPMKEDRL